MRAIIISCPNKNYWYYAHIGDVLDLTGQKWVEEDCCDRVFIPGVDDDIRSSLISYTTVDGREVCATDIRMVGELTILS